MAFSKARLIFLVKMLESLKIKGPSAYSGSVKRNAAKLLQTQTRSLFVRPVKVELRE